MHTNYFNLDILIKSAARLELPVYRHDIPRNQLIYTEDKPPIRNDDVIRVFHAFRDLEDAISACKHGLSGRTRARRVYSYEADNNPFGLFVSPDLNTVKQFGEYIIEFNAKVSELEAPVWPGGTFTVQGQYAQYFGGDKHKREQARRNAREKALSSGIESVMQSDKPELANLLLSTSEPQALFVGHLQPNRIVRIWLRSNRGEPATSMDVKTFLKANIDHKPGPYSEAARAANRIFTVDEDFNSQLFVERLSRKYKTTEERIIKIHGDDRPEKISRELDRYLWPKQIPKAVLWLSREYRKLKKRQDN